MAAHMITRCCRCGQPLVAAATGDFHCAGCLRRDSGLHYRCGSCCAFELHVGCAACPRTRSFAGHPQRELALVAGSAAATRFCDMCGAKGDVFYQCLSCDLDLHPVCVLHPSALSAHPAHHLDGHHVTLAAGDWSPCAACGRWCERWRYRCGQCGLDFHPFCPDQRDESSDEDDDGDQDDDDDDDGSACDQRLGMCCGNSTALRGNLVDSSNLPASDSIPVPSAATSASFSDKAGPTSVSNSNSNSALLAGNSNPASVAGPVPWSSLFKASSSAELELEFIPPVGGKASFSEADCAELEVFWKNALVGYFVGRSPSFGVVKAHLSKAWRGVGFTAHSLQHGFLFFRFNRFQDAAFVLEGCWSVGGHPLILRRWSPSLPIRKDSFETIPIWVRFPNLNLGLRSKHCLSKLASLLGKPLRTDRSTASLSNLEFARVCVEISVDSPLPDSVPVSVLGTDYEQPVAYSWKPDPCRACRTFSHSPEGCLLNQTTSEDPIPTGNEESKSTVTTMASSSDSF